jgi:uncharacterized RDD family membrane protein YckC
MTAATKPIADTPHAAPQYCGLPRRLAAMTYDGLLLIGLWMLAAIAAMVISGDEIAPGNAWFQLWLLAVAWLYLAISWRGGASLGMKAWRIQLHSSRPPISWLGTLIRFVVAFAGLLCFGLGFLWSLFHPRRATWHDLASGSWLTVTAATPATPVPRSPAPAATKTAKSATATTTPNFPPDAPK